MDVKRTALGCTDVFRCSANNINKVKKPTKNLTPEFLRNMNRKAVSLPSTPVKLPSPEEIRAAKAAAAEEKRLRLKGLGLDIKV